MRRLLIFLIIIGGLGFGAYYYAGTLVEGAIEQYGSEAAGTDIALSGVSLTPWQGSAQLNGLTVANPTGFGDGYAIQVSGINVAVDPAEMSSCVLGCEVLYVDEITVYDPVIKFVEGQGGSNIDKILESAQSGGEPDPNAMKVIIRTLNILGGSVSLDTPLGQLVELPLPPITLNNIGSESQPADAGIVMAEVLSELLPNITQAIATGQLEGVLEGVEGVGDEAGKIGDTIRGIFD